MSGLADQLIELGDCFAHLGAQVLVTILGGLAIGKRPLDPLQRPLGAVQCSGKPAIVHFQFATHFGDSGQALTRHGSPDKGTAPPP